MSEAVQTRKVNVGGKSFSSRNPMPIGIIGLIMVGALLWCAFNAANLPIIGGGTVYSAAFTEDAGLVEGNEVRIAGVKVGEVTSTSLAGNKVIVKFKIKNAWVGNQSLVSIKLKTLLGTKYLGIDSQGTAKQNPHQQIPLARTASPFDVYPVFTQLTETVQDINTAKLAQALNAISTTFTDTPSTVKPLLSGLTRLSTTISSRDAQLQTLLSAANSVTGVLADRDAQLTKLFADGSQLLDTLNQRRDEIHALLVNTSTLSTQLSGLVTDNQATIGPMLANLHSVLQILQNNQDSLDRGLQLLAPFYRVFNNAIGNGRWFDNYIQNLSLSGILGVAGAK